MRRRPETRTGMLRVFAARTSPSSRRWVGRVGVCLQTGGRRVVARTTSQLAALSSRRSLATLVERRRRSGASVRRRRMANCSAAERRPTQPQPLHDFSFITLMKSFRKGYCRTTHFEELKSFEKFQTLCNRRV